MKKDNKIISPKKIAQWSPSTRQKNISALQSGFFSNPKMLLSLNQRPVTAKMSTSAKLNNGNSKFDNNTTSVKTDEQPLQRKTTQSHRPSSSVTSPFKKTNRISLNIQAFDLSKQKMIKLLQQTSERKTHSYISFDTVRPPSPLFKLEKKHSVSQNQQSTNYPMDNVLDTIRQIKSQLEKVDVNLSQSKSLLIEKCVELIATAQQVRHAQNLQTSTGSNEEKLDEILVDKMKTQEKELEMRQTQLVEERKDRLRVEEQTSKIITTQEREIKIQEGKIKYLEQQMLLMRKL